MHNLHNQLLTEPNQWFLGGAVLFLALYFGVKLMASGLKERSKQK
jgi:hypothetical protein